MSFRERLRFTPARALASLFHSARRTRGPVLVRLASIGFSSPGMSLGERGDGLSLFAGDRWLAEHLTTLDEQAVPARAHSCDSSPKEVCD